MKPQRNQRRIVLLSRLTALVVSGVFLAACGGLTKSDKPAVQTWWLEPVSLSGVSDQEIVDVSIYVSAVPGLDTDKLLTLSAQAELSHFAGARWVDNAPELFNSLISRSLESGGKYNTSEARSEDGHEQCKLVLELTEFFTRVSSGADSTASATGTSLAFSGYFQCSENASVEVSFEGSRSVNGNRIESIVAAFQNMSDQAFREILKQLK